MDYNNLTTMIVMNVPYLLLEVLIKLDETY